MAQRQADLAGRTLARTYALERILGRGGMGAVYAARHLRTGGLCAVKLLDADAAADADTLRRFRNEARIVSSLRHPNIVQVMDFDLDEDGTPFLVMELLVGVDLQQRLKQVGRMPLGEVLDLARQVGSALHAAHAIGIVHRDVKPQNIFMCYHELADRTIEVAKVVDFGISKIRDTAQQTHTTTVLGTPHYMSPEAARAQNEELDGRSDQWALAVILYRALSGKLPFNNPDPLAVLFQVVNEEPLPLSELCPEVPLHVIRAIERAMSKAKEARFPTTADFVRALTDPEMEGYDSIEVVEVDEVLPEPPRRQLLLWGVIGVGAALGLAGALGWRTLHPIGTLNQPAVGVQQPSVPAAASAPQQEEYPRPTASPLLPEPPPQPLSPEPVMGEAAEARKQEVVKHHKDHRDPALKDPEAKDSEVKDPANSEPKASEPKLDDDF